MNDRDLLLAALDMLLALLVVFVLGFFAVRYDETRGPHSEILSLETLKTEIEGDYESLHFLGIYLGDDYIQLREYHLGQWSDPGPQYFGDWSDILAHELASNDLPIVIYEIDESANLGDLVRQVSIAGQPIGIAEIANSREARQ